MAVHRRARLLREVDGGQRERGRPSASAAVRHVSAPPRPLRNKGLPRPGSLCGPSPGSENVRPSNGVPTQESSPRRSCSRTRPPRRARRDADAAPLRTQAQRECRQRCRRPLLRRSQAGAASRPTALRSRAPRRRSCADHAGVIDQPAPERPRDHAEEQHEAARETSDALRLAARAVQQRHDPVADHDRQPERRRVHRRERQEPAVDDGR